MKKLISHDTQSGAVLGGYVFSPSTNKVTITGLSFNLALEQILLITDTTAGIIIYNFANSSLNGTIANNVITLDYNCSALSATDSLQIYVDISDTAPVDTAMMTDAYTHVLLERICDLLEPMATQDGSQRQRVTVDALTAGQTLSTVTTVGTVSTVSSITAGTISTITNPVPLGNLATWGTAPGGNIEWQMIDWARGAYNEGIRSQLTFGN